ncbi:MAG: hypothetical protein IJ262_04350 [Clostridia bacterium]|nr:hypothetical protein [Clostridia bacterium]
MQTNELVSEVISMINNAYSYLGNFEAINAFDKKDLPLPIKKTYLAVRTTENLVNFVKNDNMELCEKNDIEVSINIYAPLRESTVEIYTLAEALLDSLSTYYSGKIKGYFIGAISVDDDLKAFKLPCKLFVVYEQCPAYSEEGAIIKPYAEFFCKSHIKDEVMHVTEDERAYFSQPFVTGTYEGDGESEQIIYLDFRPKVIIVYRASGCVYGLSEDLPASFFAVSSNAASMKGLYPVSNGFRVNQNSTYVSKGTYPRLNEAEVTYGYVAFK